MEENPEKQKPECQSDKQTSDKQTSEQNIIEQLKPQKRTFWSDIKNVKKNWKIVQSSPYASLQFRYQIQKYLLIALGLFLLYSFYNIIVIYNGGSSIMTLVGRILILLILIFIIIKGWNTLKPLKKQLEQYKNKPQHVNYKQLNTEQEIDDILANFDKT
jgi:large-conductance mechanosensitive channel